MLFNHPCELCPTSLPLQKMESVRKYAVNNNLLALNSVCSFCGKMGDILVLNCGMHFICDGCHRNRRLQRVCPFCTMRDQRYVSEREGFIDVDN